MSASPEPIPEPEAQHGFDDSRRLPGANRWFAGAAVQLTPLGSAARLPAAHAGWAQRVQAAASALGWADPQPRVQLPTQVQAAAGTVTLAFAAPDALLFTATEVNEWAWERAAEAAVGTQDGFDLAQPALARTDTAADAFAWFADRAKAEFNAPLQALRDAAAAHGVPLLADDDTASIGSGAGSSDVWPLAELPNIGQLPWPQLRRVPTALVTGSNGKTTTVRLLAAMAAAAGRTAGYCCTEGVFVAGVAVAAGDWSGPAGARAVLRDQRVQTAVLETARGGLLRRGLALDRADVAVITNISPDHLGEYGVESADDLAEVKLVVARAVAARGTLVLNGDDALLTRAAASVAAAQRAWFASDADSPTLQRARADGDSTCGVRGGVLVLHHGEHDHALGAVADMPMTLAGAAQHNVMNAAAGALAAAALGLSVEAIRRTLADFGRDPRDNAGRLERWPWRGATVLVDYAHNPEGLAQLLAVARALHPRRLGLLLGQAGNRDDDAIRALAHVAAGFAPDLVLVKELPQMLRGRAAGDVPALLERALLGAGLPPDRLAHEPDEATAARALLAWAQPGDVVVLPVHTGSVRQALAAALTAELKIERLAL